MILHGAPVKEEIKAELIEKIKKLKRKPCLAIIQIGNREDANIYIRNKVKFGEEIGAEVLVKKESDISEKELIKNIQILNNNKEIDGIIVQLPLPRDLDADKILNTISVKKDVDGLSRTNDPENIVIPATARGVIALFDYYKIQIKNKKVAVIGQSALTGRPIADELEKRGAIVYRCDINTEDIPKITKDCDILVSAAGQARLVTGNFVNEKQIVIDVGINRISPESKLIGDVIFEEVEPLVAAITPVPGGVGPLTVACLFENLLDLCYHAS